MNIQDIVDNCTDDVVLLNNFEIHWSRKGVGFGQYYFRVVDGVVHISNECMSKHSIKRTLSMMVDNAILDDPISLNSDLIISTDERAKQGVEPSKEEILNYSTQHQIEQNIAKSILQEHAYGGKPPHGYADWDSYWENY